MAINRIATLQNAATATGNGVAMDISGYKNLALVVTGTFVGTVTFEVSIDGTNYVGLAMRDSDGATEAYVLTATAPGGFFSNLIGGYQFFRARISAYTSGSITVVAGAQSDGS